MGSFMGALGQDATLCLLACLLASLSSQIWPQKFARSSTHYKAPTSFLFGAEKIRSFFGQNGAIHSTAFPAAHLCVPDSVFAALLRR
jgi:hypothetical protein